MPADPLAAALHEAFAPVWQRLGERIARGEVDLGRRWPELSFYVLGDRLLARCFFAIVPADRVVAPPPPLAPHWAAALAPDGALFTALLAALGAVEAELRRGAVQTLALHLAVYAGVAALTVARPGRASEVVRVWQWRDDAWQTTDLDAARPLLGHDQWQPARTTQAG